MKCAKYALQLFIKSLPQNSKFEIISFGSKFEALSRELYGFEYTDKNVEDALDAIYGFDADLGGTDILKPLEYVFKQTKYHKETRIFLLTDGEVNN